MLAIEFLDELVFGVGDTAWPLIRHDLHLAYFAVSVLLTAPRFAAVCIEPILGVMARGARRPQMVAGGGLAFGAALVLVSQASTFWLLLLALVLLYPASGAFVSLSQATLMDLDAAGRESGMARWTLAGSVGVVLGPLILGLALFAGVGWRGAYLLLAVPAIPLALWARRLPHGIGGNTSWREGVRSALRALRSREVLRWLVALEAADMMGDLLNGYLALYVVDVVGIAPTRAGIAVFTITIASLAGDALLIPLLRRVPGIRYVRISAFAIIAVYPAFLLVPGFAPKLVLLVLLGLLRAGWYAIPQARLYEEIPESSESILVLSNIGGLLTATVPLVLGLAAQRFGLGAAMWLLLIGPPGLLLLTRGVPALMESS